MSHDSSLSQRLTHIASLLTIAFPPLLLVGSAGADIALSAIAILFMVHSTITHNWQWLRTPWLSCLLLLWGYISLRAVMAEEPAEALRRAVPFIRFPLSAAALAFWTMRQPRTERRFILSLITTLSFLIADSLLQYVIGFDILGNPRVTEHTHYRLSGPFSYKKLIVGILLAWLSLPACFYLLRLPDGTTRTGKSFYLAIGFCVMSLATIALSGERMALLLALLGWLVAFPLLLRKKKLMIPLLAGMATLLGALSMAAPSLFERQVQATVETLSHWQESPYGKIMSSDLKLAAVNPLFGLGANHFRIACPKIYAGADEAYLKAVCNIHPHNIYFEWWIESGLIGFTLFLGFLFFALRECWRAWPVMRMNPLFLGWSVAFFLRVWPIGSTTGFFSNWGAPPFWLAAGMFAFYCTLPKREAAPQ